MNRKEKLMTLVSSEKPSTIEKNKTRIKNRAILRESQKIALKVLERLDYLGWTQKDLAKKMGVSPQQITKIVRGRENLTLETQIRLQRILDIPILATYYEYRFDENTNSKKVETTHLVVVVNQPTDITDNESLLLKKELKSEYSNEAFEFTATYSNLA